MIDIQNTTKIYNSKKGSVIALNEVSLQVPDNKFVLIKGPSGCGKSTLLFTLGGMLMPSSGKVEVLGKELYKLPEKDRSLFRAQELGFVYQSYHLIPYLNVLENILLVNKNGDKQVEEIEATALAKQLNLEDRLKHTPSELSIGEKQRVALARALITKPKLILADEPTGNLDPKNTQEVLKHLEQFHKNGGAIIMVSHGNEADELAEITILMEKGKITKINSK